MSEEKISFAQFIFDEMKRRAKLNDEDYINPHFLTEIAVLLDVYYKLDDEEVDEWITKMFDQ